MTDFHDYDYRHLELTDEELGKISTTELIASTFKIYGTIFGVCFLVFLILRARFPSVYTFNSIPREGSTNQLALERHGYVEWIWKIFKYTDDEIFQNCGMSAMVYLRFLRLGLKLAAWGVFNSIYLIPINVYGCRSAEDECTSLSDGVNRASLGNISARNPSLLATTLAAYILFGKAMWYIFREFRWFTKYRHKFLTRPRPDNYTVYVAHIPKLYRSDVALLEYFRSVFSHGDVLEAKIALDIHGLEKKVVKRRKIVQNLEHSFNIRSIKGTEPKNIRSLKKELHKLNEEISSVITQIEQAKDDEKKKFLRDMLAVNGLECSTSIGDLSTMSSSGANSSRTISIRRQENLRQYSKASRHLMVGMSDDEEDKAESGSGSGQGEIPYTIPSAGMSEGSYEFILGGVASNSTNDLCGLDSTSHSGGEHVHQKSPTCDTIDTNTLMNGGKLHFSENSYMDFDASLVIEEHADLDLDQDQLTPLTKGRKTLNSKKHKQSISLNSFGTTTSKTLGSAKKSLQEVGRTVGNVGRNVGKGVGSVGKHVGSVGKHVGKNVQTAYGKTVGKTVGHIANTKIGKTVAGRVNQSVVVMKKAAGNTVKKSVISVKDLAVHSAHLATKASSRMTRLLVSGEDGQVLESGFVTFTNLSTKTQCTQILHHETPFKFVVKDAPLPRDIIWANVGVPHEELQFGYLLAQAATVALLIFWTFPVAFFTSLSEAGSLKDVIPTLAKTIDDNPWVAVFLAQLSPILLVILTALLPVVLNVLCRYEGHVGKNDLKASLLTKLASFMVSQNEQHSFCIKKSISEFSPRQIIQIFFVQAISGSIFDKLKDMIDEPSKIIELLATSIPTQVKSFIQFVLVQMFLGCSIEILRLVRVAMGVARNRFGPNLSEKERNSKFLFLEPISATEQMEYPMLYSEMALYFMVNLIYSCIAPVMSYFMLLTFGVLSVVYRHQVIYIYSDENDKGGKLWPCMIHLLITCMLISEVTLIGIMFLKEGIVAASLLVPLLACTVLFLFYIKQEHFRITEFVPSTICNEQDIRNHDTLDLSFLRDKYLQPPMKVKISYPENDIRIISEEIQFTPTYERMEEGIEETPFTANRLRLDTVASASDEDEAIEYLESTIPYEERTRALNLTYDKMEEGDEIAPFTGKRLVLETVASMDEGDEYEGIEFPDKNRTNLDEHFESSNTEDEEKRNQNNGAEPQTSSDVKRFLINKNDDEVNSTSSGASNEVEAEIKKIGSVASNVVDEHGDQSFFENGIKEVFRITEHDSENDDHSYNSFEDNIGTVSSAEC